jgi:Protein of unknown function (DUF4238)/Queuosine biosynthesis protein QueC
VRTNRSGTTRSVDLCADTGPGRVRDAITAVRSSRFHRAAIYSRITRRNGGVGLLPYRWGIRHIVAGMCGTDYSGYADCGDETIKAVQVALNLGMQRHLPLLQFHLKMHLLMWGSGQGIVRLGYKMPMPREPKHHYIPVFYLQQWAGEDRQLVEYCRRYEGVVARPTFPDGTGYVRGLYKLPDAPPGDEYVVETKLMSSIDNWAAKALQQMMQDGENAGRLGGHEATGWLQFLYSLIVRTPEHLLLVKDKLATLDASQVLENTRTVYPDVRGPYDPETFDEFKAAFLKNPIQVAPARVLPQFMTSKRVILLLASFRWHTVKTDAAEYPLLTSDRSSHVQRPLRT